MIHTKLDYAPPANSLLSSSLLRCIRLCQLITYGMARLLLRLIPNRITIKIKPGDLKPGFCYVIAANHQSMLDPFVICSCLPYPVWSLLRSFRFMAYNALFKKQPLRSILLSLGSFPASAHTQYASGLNAAMSFLAQGQTVVIFPQGERRPLKGRARTGVRVLADLPKVVVIPARIEWQRQGRWRRSFTLVVGRPALEQNSTAQQILDRIYRLPGHDSTN